MHAVRDTGGQVRAAPRRVVVAGDLFHGRVPAGALYVGRAAPGLPGSPWANPHRVGRCRTCSVASVVEHDQADAVRAYARDLAGAPGRVGRARVELAGRDLACWCRSGPCHADVLLQAANPSAGPDASTGAVPGSTRSPQ